MKLSKLANNIAISPILPFAAALNAKKAAGETVYNLTIGDFDPSIYPIPEQLTAQSIKAYEAGETNYPGAVGMPMLRQGVADLLNRTCGLNYGADDVQISCGSRPLIYAAYKVIVDAGDKVVYPVPSWNNDHYCQLTEAQVVEIETDASTDFMPTAEQITPHLKGATLLALCSPQNPTGTVFAREQLKQICDAVVAENKRRSPDEKALYVMFDQVYWLLTFGSTQFYHPLKQCPAIEPYAIFVDGLSKSLAGTGIRIGWGTAPKVLLNKMQALLAHTGSWAPRPEQVAAGHFLQNATDVDQYLKQFRGQLESRLDAFYKGIIDLKTKGFPVDAIAPQAAIYLSVNIDLKGKKTAEGIILDSSDAVHEHLLNEAGIGVLPFSWFGAKSHGDWFRLSVGTCQQSEIPLVLHALEQSMAKLH